MSECRPVGFHSRPRLPVLTLARPGGARLMGSAMPSRHSYVRFFPSDWIAGTSRMSRLHKAVYFDVCCYVWDKAEPCPDAELPLMFGDLDGWETALEQLIASGKLTRGDQGVSNERAMEEAKRALDVWQRKSQGGKSGAGKRWSDGSPNSTPNGSPIGSLNGSLPKTHGSPNAEPEPEPEPEPAPPNPPKGGGLYTAEFEQFWRLYPNRKGKAQAAKAWNKLSADDRFAAMSDVPLRMGRDRDWLKDGGKFIPHASTYLKQRRWEDDIQPEVSDEPKRTITPADRVRAAYRERFGDESGKPVPAHDSDIRPLVDGEVRGPGRRGMGGGSR